MPDDSGVSNTFYCYTRGARAVRHPNCDARYRSPVAYRGGETWPYLWVEPHTFNDVLTPDLATQNHQAKVVITVA